MEQQFRLNSTTNNKVVPEDLEQAFNTFNQLSTQLAESYRALETRVASLNKELATSREAQYRELTEKGKLADRLETLLNALPGGVVVLDGNGCVQEHNPAAVELLGPLTEGESWSHIISRSFSPRNDDGHEVSLTDGRRVNISTCPLGNEPGQILLITNVTEMRDLQDRLSQHQRLAAMGKTAAALAHQIRTPLSSAVLHASNLKRLHLSDSERFNVVERIMSRLRHLERLVTDMLLYAKGNTSGEEQCDIYSVLSELTSSLDTQLQSSQTQCIIHDESGGARVDINRQMFISALSNIIDNAIKAMGRGGQITISAYLTDQYELEIHIQDNGPGFSEEAREQAFDPFFTTRAEGTGLGLAVVAAILRSHQGEVSLDSQPGEGSHFVLTLPGSRVHTPQSTGDDNSKFNNSSVANA